jgi:hypothetical protein
VLYSSVLKKLNLTSVVTVFYSSVLLLIFAGCGGGSGGDGGGAGSENEPPVASAGSDQTVQEGASVTLDSSASNDSDGSITQYAWIQTNGPTVSLTNANNAQASFTAPTVTGATDFTFQITVTDDANATNTDTVTITVNPGTTSSQQRIHFMHYDFDNNGTAEGLAEISYDADGYVTNINYSYTDDGTPDTDFRGIFALDFGNKDETNVYAYDTEGRVSSIIETTSSDRYESYYTWNDDDLITNVRYEYYDSVGALQNIVRFTLTYTGGQLESWDEEFEPTGSAAMPLAEGTITYDVTTGLPNLLSRTESLGGITEESSLAFTSSGQIQTITTTIPSVPDYESSVGFSYAWATHPFVVSGKNREGDIFNRQANPDDPADTYNWAYSYTDSLLQTQYIDMGSDVVHDATITFEWENGVCKRNFIWAPRAEPNFIATGNEPYVPGTGYSRLDYCDTRGSKL